ncbi:MAG: glycosyltransferase [Acidobacteriota bacterium]
MTKVIVISGALAQVPWQGGLAWLHLQFLLGFRRLGWEVLFIDRLEPEMCIDDSGAPAPVAESVNLRYFRQVMIEYGFDDSFSLIYNRGEQTIGMPRERVLEKAAASDALFNVMGYLKDEEILDKCSRKVFIDIDPGFGQMWRGLGLHDAFKGHDAFVTLGQNIGKRECSIPTCGLEWIASPQPVVLAHWPRQPAPSTGRFTSIGAWRGPNGPITYNGRTYGLRVHEFRKFVGLPSACVDTEFEMALDIHPAETSDINLLRENGWSLVDPRIVAAGPAAYRDYICGSKAEFMVPKQIYVDTNSGLLSDRSAYYLATGRPVLARDTGIRDLYPTKKGLLTFDTFEEAAAGVEAINRDYLQHAHAARAIAEEYLDSDKVLAQLLTRLSIT